MIVVDRPCYACGALQGLPDCERCGAPQFSSNPAATLSVYVIRAECGLHKIGVTVGSTTSRINQIRRKSSQPITVERVIYPSCMDAEQWLHDYLEADRVPDQARAEGLKNVMEWFLPSEPVLRLAASEPFLSVEAAAQGRAEADAKQLLKLPLVPVLHPCFTGSLSASQAHKPNPGPARPVPTRPVLPGHSSPVSSLREVWTENDNGSTFRAEVAGASARGGTA